MTDAREKIERILDKDRLWPDAAATADAILAAMPEIVRGMIKPLEWNKSHIEPWDGDFHSIPTKYTIRGWGDENYRLAYAGGFGVYNSPSAAKAAANKLEQDAILSALSTQGEG